MKEYNAIFVDCMNIRAGFCGTVFIFNYSDEKFCNLRLFQPSFFRLFLIRGRHSAIFSL